MVVVNDRGEPIVRVAGPAPVEATEQALWLDGWLRSAGLPAPWSYTVAPSRRALAAWREGWHQGHVAPARAHVAGCPGVLLDEHAETVAPCPACSPAPALSPVAS